MVYIGLEKWGDRSRYDSLTITQGFINFTGVFFNVGFPSIKI